MTPALSILTPCIWKRADKARELAEKIEKQCRALQLDHGTVEHLCLFDGMTNTVGEKRQMLLDSAQGDYIAYVDDDDDIEGDYVGRILNATANKPDVVTFKQRVFVDDMEGVAVFGINSTDEAFNPGHEFNRAPWHICAWRRERVKRCQFPISNYGEDLSWSIQARQMARTAIHIDKIMCTYRHSSKETAAPPPVQ